MFSYRLNNYSVHFQIDSGIAVSTISKADCINAGGAIVSTSRHLIGYSDNQVLLCGETDIKVTYNNNSYLHKFFVVNDNSVNFSVEIRAQN